MALPLRARLSHFFSAARAWPADAEAASGARAMTCSAVHIGMRKSLPERPRARAGACGAGPRGVMGAASGHRPRIGDRPRSMGGPIASRA
jgi:hypothetical protein